MYKILRYLKKKKKLLLEFCYANNNEFKVEGYTNAKWVGDQIDKRATFVYFTFIRET